jgi:chromosome partitioning protein
MSSVVAISNHKGGVAKTTTCFSLGACLAKLGHRTLVVDLDPQADLTVSAGLDAEALDWTVVDLLSTANGANPAPLSIFSTSAPRLDILPADPRLASTERNLYDVEGYETRLNSLLEPLQTEYSYILCNYSAGIILSKVRAKNLHETCKTDANWRCMKIFRRFAPQNDTSAE